MSRANRRLGKSCGERRRWHELSAGGRIVVVEAGWGPYIGAGAGAAMATGNAGRSTAGLLYLEAGMVFEVTTRIGLDLRSFLAVIAGGGEGFPFSSLNLGVRYRFSR